MAKNKILVRAKVAVSPMDDIHSLAWKLGCGSAMQGGLPSIRNALDFTPAPKITIMMIAALTAWPVRI